MKKIFSLLLVFAMILSLCACGGNNNSTETTNTTNTNDSAKVDENIPLLNLEQLWSTLDSNEAKAISEYNKKQYKVTLQVMNIKSDSFEYATTYLGSKRFVCVKLPTEELANLSSGEEITVLGTVVLSGRYVYINDASIVK